MCIYKTFAAPENNEGEKQKLCLHYAIELCVFASLYNLKKKKKSKKIIKAFVFSKLAWVKVTKVKRYVSGCSQQKQFKLGGVVSGKCICICSGT